MLKKIPIVALTAMTLLIIPACRSNNGSEITREKAIDFLYTTMSLPDKVDYDSAFYARNVDLALQAREEMPWGKSVPEREFLHFVLPVRVNNENLDDAREVFYKELKPRVENLSMKDAILEVNHWCHEKVTYTPSDGRTSSPLSAVSQAIGRCGEESTFAVAAMRSVGIPARQIYTPRWAHTDDNHAWIEVWADGEWHFLGACEPEPVLDLAWFNDPASRGLLMNTDVPGEYDGPEEVLRQLPNQTTINVTPNYAPVRTLPVKVVKADGSPASGATVMYCIYNYAEYYPAVTKTADDEGRSSLTSGKGDMVVWATDGERFGIMKSGDGDEECVVVLDKENNGPASFTYDIIPPKSSGSAPEVTPEMREANNVRFAREDSIRNAYMATFATAEQGTVLARELGLDEKAVAKILTESRGNHTAIENLLRKLEPSDRVKAVNLLDVVTEKDRRDIPMDVIIDNITCSVSPEELAGGRKLSGDDYAKYVLSPRIEREMLKPWRKYLRDELAKEGVAADPVELAQWVNKNIADAGTSDNPKLLRMTPWAVMKVRKADNVSRGIFYVAAARTLGIPARIDPVTGDVQWMRNDGKWNNVVFGDEATARETGETGMLKIKYKPTAQVPDPKYYSQFSISKIENGRPRQLEYAEDGSYNSIFSNGVELEAGQYILTSGQRLANGGVLAKSEIFIVKPGETTEVHLDIRHDDSEIEVIGSLNAETIYHDLKLATDKSILSTTGRGYYVVGVISPNAEPSVHLLNDLSAVASQLEDQTLTILLLFENENEASRFNKEAFKSLPKNVVFGIDKDGKVKEELSQSLHLGNVQLPLVAIADTFNRVVWESHGYAIGTGERLLDVLTRIK